jgi:hypothetical protein
MRADKRVCGLFVLCALLSRPGLGWAGTLGLNNPPVPMNAAAEGMGEAVAADGTLFIATAYNPALLANAPFNGEVALGFNASNNIFKIGDYLSSNGSPQPTQSFDGGAGLNIALKFDDHWGFQIYNYTHGIFQIMDNGSVENITGPAYLDTVALATYCFTPLEEETPLTVGVNLKVVNHYIGFINSSGNPGDLSNFVNQLTTNINQNTLRWGLDLGLLYDFKEEHLSLGLSALELFHSAGTPALAIYGGNLDPAPVVVKFGASWHPIKPFVLNADVDDLFSDTSYYQGLSLGYHVKLGFSYDLLKILILRGGLSNGNVCGGAGLPFLGLDYAYAVDDLTQVYTHFLQFKAVM